MYEISNVHLEDYTSDTDDQKITCTETELRHINDEHEEPSTETILVDDISKIRRDTDTSHTGFKLIGGAFGAFALVFSFMALPFLLADVFFTPIAGGLSLSAVLCWYGAVVFYRMDRGTLDVLEIKANSEWYRFFTTKEDTTFDELLSRLPHDDVHRSTITE